MKTPRPLRAAAVAVALLLLAGMPVAAQPAAPTPSLGASVEPGLVARLNATPGFAILSWDPAATNRAAVESRLDDAGISHFTFGALPMTVACAATGADVSRLAAVPGALSVYGDAPLTPTLDRSVATLFRGTPGTNFWGNLGVTGKGVGLAVLDTGISTLHPDLEMGERTKQNVRVLISHREILGPGADPPPCRDYYSEDVADNDLSSGHGTHMASVAGGDGAASNGRLKGVAPESELVGVTITDTTHVDAHPTEGVRVSTLAAVGGINFLLQNNLEGPGPTVKVALIAFAGEGLHDEWNPLSLALRDLYDFGIVPVLPVGNQGPAESDCSAASTCYFNPFAVGPYVVSVGATPRSARNSLASFSSRGDPMARTNRDPDRPFMYQPTVVAPGLGVVAARRPGTSFALDPDGARGPVQSSPQENALYTSLSGTSVAAAHVAGTIALMQEAAMKRPGSCFLTPAQVVSILQSTATPMSFYQSHEVGAGAADATAAIKAVEKTPVLTSPDPWICQ